MNNHSVNIETLISDTKDKIGKPVSSKVVCATIESLGIREKDLVCDYGYSTINELAEIIYQKLKTDSNNDNIKNLKEQEAEGISPNNIQISDYLWIKTKIFIEYYTLGIFNLLPVIIQILAIIFFGYSLWTFVGFNQIQSTSVVLGVILGLILSGGFVQVTGRQAAFYWNYKDYKMTKKTIDYLQITGIKFISILILLSFAINLLIPFYPYKVLSVIFAYAFLIGMLLLVLAPLHTIKQRWVITVSILFGTLISIALKINTTLFVFATHWLGIIGAIIFCKLFLVLFFKKLNKKIKKQSVQINKTVMLYHNYEYFFYGSFIYVFIFIDRILAWSSNKNQDLPFVVYFEKNYELGMDLAMLIFLLLSGILEYSIASFAKFIDLGQKNINSQSPKAFNSQLKKMYLQQIFLVFITSAFSFILIYYIMSAKWGFQGQFNEKLLQLSIKVCWLGGLGYMLLAWGMLNALYLFTLGQVAKPLQAIIISCIVNLGIGFFLSRFFSYEYSVIGMILGSASFVILTLKANINLFKNLDYYYYAAY